MKCGIYNKILGKSSPEQEFAKLTDPPEPIFRAKDVLVALAVVALAVVVIAGLTFDLAATVLVAAGLTIFLLDI